MHLLIIPCHFLPRGIDHGTLFYDMPLCMNGELCLGMVKDILYAVSKVTFSVPTRLPSLSGQAVYPRDGVAGETEGAEAPPPPSISSKNIGKHAPGSS